MSKVQVISLIIFGAVSFAGCDSFLDPGSDNVYTDEVLRRHASLAEGVLLHAYSDLPGMYYNHECGTDNAVANNAASAFRLAATGSLTSSDNAYGVWKGAYTDIAYCNDFLANYVNSVTWSAQSEWKNEEYRKRLSAEARVLRAYYYMQLLEGHSGVGTSGKLLGVPMIMEPVDVGNGTIIARSSFDECVRLVLEDLQYGIETLPTIYKDAPATMENKAEYDAVYGAKYNCRVSGIVAMMLKARLLYWAATPAYNPDGDISKWEEAAKAAAAVIDFHGGLAALHRSRLNFYADETGNEILWRKNIFTGYNWENDNFPPSLYGYGRTNPTQNLVDAFPASNGYPISSPLSGYVASNPYADRDPRLNTYVICHGTVFKGSVINTVDDTNDGVNKVAEKSTRTGYYLNKFMDQNASLVTGSAVKTRHYVPLLRFTEAYLIFAEASFEMLGQNSRGEFNYSSRDVIAALRSSAGIPAPDPYLASGLSDDEYRRLVLNERRLELCFEGFRYWDVRRHKDLNAMNETAKGTMDGGMTTVEIEPRKYGSHTIFGPIPYPEVQKGLEQNSGWK